jgi:L-rhamnose mutarotase
MTRMGWYARVVPERIAAYVALHAEPWPQIIALLKEARIANYSIFLDEEHNLLFSAFDYHGEDFDGDMARLDALSISREWQAIVGTCLIAPDGAGDAWVRMNEVFRLD